MHRCQAPKDGTLTEGSDLRGLTLVTRNLADVKHAGIKLLNPFVGD